MHSAFFALRAALFISLIFSFFLQFFLSPQHWCFLPSPPQFARAARRVSRPDGQPRIADSRFLPRDLRAGLERQALPVAGGGAAALHRRTAAAGRDAAARAAAVGRGETTQQVGVI